MPSQPRLNIPRFSSVFDDDMALDAALEFEDGWESAKARTRMLWGSLLLLVPIKSAALAAGPLVALPFLAVGILTMTWLIRRVWRVPDDGVFVLWLRPFHNPNLRRFPFATLLCAVLACNGTPLTIQDSTYRVSFNSIVSKGLLYLMIWAFLALVCWVVLCVTTFGLLFLLLGETNEWLYSALGVLVVLSTPVWLVRFIQRIGYSKLNERSAESAVDRLADRINRGRASYSLSIFKCKDSFWKRTIKRAVQHADSVIIDVTELRPTIEWEIETVANLIGVEPIVFCRGVAADETKDVESQIVKRLMEILGRERLLRTHRFEYPIPRTGGWVGRMRTRITQLPFFAIRMYKPVCAQMICALGASLEAAQDRDY